MVDLGRLEGFALGVNQAAILIAVTYGIQCQIHR